MNSKKNYFRLDDDSRELVRRAVNEFPITQSEIMTRASCPRKWFYRYALGLQKKGAINWHFLYGNLLHEMLAILYSNRWQGTTSKEKPIKTPLIKFPEHVLPTLEDKEQAEMLRKIARITFSNYRRYYQQFDAEMAIKSVEETYTVEYKGKVLTGKIDLVAHPEHRDGIFVWDYKTTGLLNLSVLDAWSFRFQFIYYCWLFWKATDHRPAGNYVNGILKTLLRPKKQETQDEYLARIDRDMVGDPNKYFYRVRMPLVDGMLERFEEEILGPHIDAFVLLGKQSVNINSNVLGSVCMAMNTDECHKYGSFCEFLPLCKDGKMMLSEYEQREVKHPELA